MQDKCSVNYYLIIHLSSVNKRTKQTMSTTVFANKFKFLVLCQTNEKNVAHRKKDTTFHFAIPHQIFIFITTLLS